VEEARAGRPQPTRYLFAVGDRPYCCWEHDLVPRDLEFLSGIDPNHFDSVGGLLFAHLEGDDAMSASIALRALYHQAIEALLSLLGAAAQAPEAVQAWIAKCNTQDLEDVVARLLRGDPLLTQAGRRPVDFDELSRFIHLAAWRDESGGDSTAERFGRLWRRFAHEFLDATARAEYNAIKHGNRVIAGGFELAVGVEETVGVPAPPESMISMGGSKFGSTFFQPEKVRESKLHFRTRRVSVNWSPASMGKRIVLASYSISNVVAGLQVHLGVDARSLEFRRPIPLSAFDDAWSEPLGPRKNGIDTVVRIDASDELSRADLLAELEGRGDSAR
jgi:hypothetical protein